jgi:DNA-binding XRE family transcriptional regulator
MAMLYPEWDRLIKQHRFQFGLTQQYVADLLGVSQKTISRWESGVNKPSLRHQMKFRDLFSQPSNVGLGALFAAVKTCPAPRSLCLHENLNLMALSRPAIAKNPSIVSWIGCSLTAIARGVLAEMLDDRLLQSTIQKGEIACISAVTQSNFQNAEALSAMAYRTTISFFRIDNMVFRDAISVPAPANSELGYRPVLLDEMIGAHDPSWG